MTDDSDMKILLPLQTCYQSSKMCTFFMDQWAYSRKTWKLHGNTKKIGVSVPAKR